jgi:hypothetical protein
MHKKISKGDDKKRITYGTFLSKTGKTFMPTFFVKHFPNKMKNFIKQDDLSRSYRNFTIYRNQNGWMTKKNI